ncbi:ABC transporter ATP-binding protein [Metabacillus malikii]|uniref:ABC transport system ATP-binding protein n=1 Tax=Metabacillus malikii TaxID=1504265 RepID=A0ABT9ZLV2_9BACI|nr:ABC transporter ATP-binding protein [Metabacillus malikii]MDQ0233266.1 putative ABC transport system ATP-binding protein [Metabacillus malikii]
MNKIIEIENISKTFETTKVLNDISFHIEQGSFFAIMGPSGSGKSTLLYNISGMDRPDTGRVTFNRKELTNLDDEKLSQIRLTQMGFIFQHSYLLKNLSIRDNIILPGIKSRKQSRKQVNDYADILFGKTGIKSVADHDIKEVSGGQLQRAAICRALINKPDILFGDEPTGALNSSASRDVMDIIGNVNREGTTIIIVTHDAKVAARADKVIFLIDGSIHNELTLGKYEEVMKSNREKKLLGWLEKQGF